MKTKRVFDIFFSLLGITFLSPILLLISFLILILNGRPVFFTQERPGLNCKIFKILKFRTMDLNYSIEDRYRITKLGGFLRSSSLDELPELFNILLGDMSFVGPRPLLVEYLESYNSSQIRRHDLKPGITGWAQVNGRNALDWQERFDLDLWYVENRSLLLDLRILLLTVKKVIIREGITAEGEATMKKFTGNRE